MDGVWGLNPDTPITRKLRRYREHSVSLGVEDDNGFIDRVITKRDCYLIVIGVHDHIDGVHVDEHNLIGLGLNRTVMEVMIGFGYLFGLIQVYVSSVGEPCMSVE